LQHLQESLLNQERKNTMSREVKERIQVETAQGVVVVARIKKTSESSTYDECWLGTDSVSVCKFGQAGGRLSVTPRIKGKKALSAIGSAVAKIVERDGVSPSVACQRLEAEVEMAIIEVINSVYGLAFGKAGSTADIDGWSDTDDSSDDD
jgi:hypothetical protein